jgi:hypothetical protein
MNVSLAVLAFESVFLFRGVTPRVIAIVCDWMQVGFVGEGSAASNVTFAKGARTTSPHKFQLRVAHLCLLLAANRELQRRVLLKRRRLFQT